MLKDEILKTLYAKRVMISGEALAAELGVSRNAIWKNIKQLQKEGFAITASTNKGYFLESCSRTLSPVILELELQDRAFGKPLLFFDQLSSTNTKAKALAEAGYPSGTVVVAETQTAGKGRLGRQFYSPAGQGVYFSLLVRPELFGDHTLLLTSMCAAATAEAIEKLARVQVQIKWVNDLLIGSKKICGILTEAGLNLEDQSIDYVVIGIGINCGKQTFPAELKTIATSIENESGTAINRSLLIAEVLKNIEAGFQTLQEKPFLKICREHSAVIGKTVAVCRGTQRRPAAALGLNDNGALLVRYEDGSEEALQAGEVSIRL